MRELCQIVMKMKPTGYAEKNTDKYDITSEILKK